jgi:hypothetical protein
VIKLRKERQGKGALIMKFAKVLTASMLMLILTTAGASAVTGLDLNPAGFGPVIKGFQLGEPTTLSEFADKCLRFYGESYFFHFSVNGKDNKSAGTMEIFSKNGKDLYSAQITGIFRELTEGMFDKNSKNLQASMEELIRLLDEETGKYDNAFCFFEYPYGSMNRMTIEKNNNGPLRYRSLKFPPSVFGASNMPSEDFARAVMDNYPMGKMAEDGGFYTTDESQNYKNGWNATVNNGSGISLNVCEARGQTSFD